MEEFLRDFEEDIVYVDNEDGTLSVISMSEEEEDNEEVPQVFLDFARNLGKTKVYFLHYFYNL